MDKYRSPPTSPSVLEMMYPGAVNYDEAAAEEEMDARARFDEQWSSQSSEPAPKTPKLLINYQDAMGNVKTVARIELLS